MSSGDLEALKKELARIMKKLRSSNVRKRLDALNELNELIKRDPRVIKPFIQILMTIIDTGYEDEKYAAISCVRTAAKDKPEYIMPLVNSIKNQLKYTIYDSSLAIYPPGVQIRTNSIVTLIYITTKHPEVFTEDMVEHLVENITPPVYTTSENRPKALLRLYRATIDLSALLLAHNPEMGKKLIGPILDLGNDPSMEIKSRSLRPLVIISRKYPDVMKDSVQKLSSYLRYPIYRPDTSDKNLAEIYREVIDIYSNIAEKNPQMLTPVVNIISGVLRDSFKYETWQREARENEVSLQKSVRRLVEVLVDRMPEVIVPVIVEHLKDIEPLRQYIFELLNKLAETRPEIVVKAITPLLTDENVNARQLSVHLLGEIGEKNPDLVRKHIPVILKLIEDRYIHVRKRAAYAIGKIGTTKPEYVSSAVPSMVPLLSDPYEAVRIYTIDAITRIGKNHPKYIVAAIPTLIKLMEDQNLNVRKMAIAAIKTLNIDPREYTELLKRMQFVNKNLATIRARGAPVDTLENEFQNAKKLMQEAKWSLARERVDAIAEAIEILRRNSRPALDVKLSLSGDRDSEWIPFTIDILNKGNAHAKDIKINFTSGIETRGNTFVPLLESRSGMEAKIEAKIKSPRFRCTITYADFDNTPYEAEFEGDIPEKGEMTYSYRESFDPSVVDRMVQNALFGTTEEGEEEGKEEESTDEQEFVVVSEETVGDDGTEGGSEEVEDEEGEKKGEEKPEEENAGDGMICPHCGASIPVDSIFCYKCGKRVRE